MNKRSLLSLARRFGLTALLLSTNLAYAGSTNPHTLTPEDFLQRAHFSKAFEKYLAMQRVEVAIVARIGRPRSQLPKGVNFTHVGIAVYSLATTTEQRPLPGYVFYNLYQSSSDSSRSELVIDSAADFFANTTEPRAGVVIPDIRLQRSIKRLLISEHYAQLHRPQYSVIANPMNLTFQNCTEFVLDLLTAAIYQTHDKYKIKANQRAHFSPTVIDMSRGKIRLGSIFNRGLSLSDQGSEIATTTFGSISEYLQRHRAIKSRLTLCTQTPIADIECDIYIQPAG